MKKPLRNIIVLSMLLGATAGLLPAAVFGASFTAQSNAQINYQGRLVTPQNVAVPTGAYNMRFSLYNSTATSAVPVWQETLTDGDRVQVTKGLFSVMLGSTSPLTAVDFNQVLYLGVEIGGREATPEWDGEMLPRKIIGSVPSAFIANSVVGELASTTYATSVYATTTNLFAQDAVISNLTAVTQAITGLIFGNATGTNATTTNFFSNLGTFDDLYVNNYQQNGGTSAITSSVQTGNIFSVIDNAITNGTLIYQSLTANAGNGQESLGQIIELVDNTTAGGGYTGLTVRVSGNGTGSGEKNLLQLIPGASNEVVFDSLGSLRPTTAANANTNSIGSPSYYWKNGYFDTLTANNLSGTVVTGATSNRTWTVGSTETGDVNEAIIFQRNSGSGNATFEWNASGGLLNDQRFLSVNYPFNATYTITDASIATSSSLYSGLLTNNTTVGTQRLLSLTNTGTGTTENGLYVNNTGTGVSAIEVAGTWTNALVTAPGSGNVGIGTLTPGALLDVNGTLRVKDDNPVQWGANAQKPYIQGSSATNYLELGTADQPRMRIDSSGNVGVGTVGPLSKLSVNGGVAIGTYSDASAAPSNGLIVSGNVGIGTTTPAAALHLGSDAGTLATGIQFGSDVNLYRSTANTLYTPDALSAFNFRANNTGAEATPAFSFFNDNNTGMFSPSADNLGFVTAGSEVVRITSTGNVGVGTTSPTQRLHVAGNILAGSSDLIANFASAVGITDFAAILGDADTDIPGLVLGNRQTSNQRFQLYLDAPNNQVTFNNTFTSGAYADYVFRTGASELVRIKSSGNVGIGTSSPSSKLHVVGSIQTDSGSDFITASNFRPVVSGGALRFYSSNGTTELMQLANTGNLSLGTTTQPYRFYAYTPSTALAWFDHGVSTTQPVIIGSSANVTTNTGLYLRTTGTATIQTGATAKLVFVDGADTNMIIDGSTGNVGIGTTTPSATLHVVGTTRFDGTTTFSTSGGSSLWTLSTFLQGTGAVNGAPSLRYDGGSVSSPAYSFTGDSADTGIYRAGADILSFATAGTNRMNIDASGNVGIGTLTPTAGRFQVNQLTDSSNTGMTVVNAAGTQGMRMWVDGLIGSIDVSSAGAGVLALNRGGGNVGIGTTSPQRQLHISGTNAYVRLDGSANSGTEIYESGVRKWIIDNISSDDRLRFFSDTASEVMSITQGGNVGIGTSSPSALLTVAGSQGGILIDRTGNDSYIQLSSNGVAAGQLRYFAQNVLSIADANGTDRVVFDTSSGNVGIGTTTPTGKLTVTSGSSGASVSTNADDLMIENSTTGGLSILTPNTASGLIYFGDPQNSSAGSIQYAHLTDQMNFSTGGSSRMSLSATGLGIGTTSPTSKFEVWGDSYFTSTGTTYVTLNRNATSNFGQYRLYTGDSMRWGLGMTNNSTDDFSITTDGTTAGSKLYVQRSTGNVGIGTTTPNSTLTVVGNGTYAADSINFGISVANATTPTERLYLGVDNSLGVNGSAYIQSIRSGSAYTNLLLNPNGGNVGIGTTTPQEKLHVEGGNILLSNNQYLRAYNSTGLIARNIIGNDSSNHLIIGTANTSTMGDVKIYAGTASRSISFFADGVNESVKITSSGNVGIGTTSPGTKLQVASDSSDKLWLTGVTNPLMQLRLGYDVTNNYGYIQSLQSGTAFKTLALNPSGGNVGIGTTSPLTKLQIDFDSGTALTGTTAFGGLHMQSAGANDDFVGITAGGPSSTNTLAGVLMQVSNAYGSRLHFLTSNSIGGGMSQRMIINENGNVGIGTNSPTANLVVSKSYAEPTGGIASSTIAVLSNNNVANGTSTLSILARSSAPSTINFGSQLGERSGYIDYQVGAISPYIANTMRFGTGGADRMVIDGNGNVGIGTTTPSTKLHISNSTGGNTLTLQGGSGATQAALVFSDSNVGETVISRITPNVLSLSNGTESAGLSFETVVNGTLAERMRIHTNGNVGIGTSSPAYKLSIDHQTAGFAFDLNRSDSNGNSLMRIGNTLASTTVGMYAGITNAPFVINRSGSYSDFVLNASGNIGIGTTSPSAKLDIYGSGSVIGQITSSDNDARLQLTARGTGGRDWYMQTGNTSSGLSGVFRIQDATAGATRLLIDTNGNVGIGTSTPNSLLNINGSTPLLTLSNSSTALDSGNILGQFNFDSLDTTAGMNGTWSKIRAQANGLWDGTAGDGADIIFSTRTVADGSLQDRMVITANGNIGIGTTTPAAKLDVRGGTISAIFSDVTTDLTNKTSRITSAHYDNSEEPVGLFVATSASGSNLVSIGGGSSLVNAATTLSFYTAGNNTTTTGTERMTITSAGYIGIGTTSPVAKLSVAGDAFIGGNLTATGTLAVLGSTSIQDLTFVNAIGTSATTSNFFATTASSTNLFSSALTVGGSNLVVAGNKVGIATTTLTEALNIDGNVRISNNVISPDSVTLGSETALGLRITNPNGYVSVTPLNNSGAHIYTSLPRFYFNVTPTSINGAFSAYSTTDLKLQTGSGAATRMTIRATDGYVGIGTTSPSSLLSVAGDAYVAGNITATGTLNVTGISTLGSTINLVSAGAQIVRSGNELQIKNTNPNPITFYTNNSERLRVDASGNFGIGTTSPVAMLSVAGDAFIGGNLTATGTLAILGATSLQDFTFTNATGTSMYATTASSTNLFSSLLTVGGDGLIVNSSKYVGIGTTSPVEKLSVAGNLYATGTVYAGPNKDIATTKSTAARTIYVDATSGNDSTGTGTSGAPYKTINRALQDVPDVMEHSYTIQLAAGVYREFVNIKKLGNLSGDTAGAANTLTIQGNTSDPNSYRITGSDASADTTAVRLFGVFINTPGIMTKLSGLRIDYATAYAVAVQSSWGRFATVNISNAPNGILADDSSILDFRTGGTINITGTSGSSGFGIVFQKKGTLWASGATLNISTFSQGIRSFDGGVSGYGGTYNISNPSKLAGTFGAQLIQSDGLHDTVMNVTNMDIGVGVYNSSYLDLDSTSSFTNVNTAVDATISAGLDVDTTTFTSVTTKYNVQYNSVVDARDEATTGKIVASVSGASPIANSATSTAFDFDTVNTLSTAGAKLFSLKNAGSEKLTVDRNGNVGIGTSTPWATLSASGTVAFSGLTASTGAGSLCLTSGNEVVYNAGSDACLPSLRSTKHSIQSLSFDALTDINALDPVSFVYNFDGSRTRYGFIAEDASAVDARFGTYDANGNLTGIDDRALIALSIKGIKELSGKVEANISAVAGLRIDLAVATSSIAELQAFASTTNARLAALELRVGTLENASTTGLTLDATSTNPFIASVLSVLGAKIENSIARFTSLIADAFTVGSKEKPTGITFYDSVTGNPFCLRVTNGVSVTTAGDCATPQSQAVVMTSGSSEPAPAPVEVSTSTPSVDTQATSTPATVDTASSTPATGETPSAPVTTDTASSAPTGTSSSTAPADTTASTSETAPVDFAPVTSADTAPSESATT